jgi:hypothetical protein
MPDPVPTGLIAILRGVRPDEVLDIAEGIVAAGLSAIEAPLNSPDPLGSVAALVEQFGDEVEIGAGTVLTADQVRECERAGARIIVAPDTDAEVISTALELGLTPLPGRRNTDGGLRRDQGRCHQGQTLPLLGGGGQRDEGLERSSSRRHRTLPCRGSGSRQRRRMAKRRSRGPGPGFLSLSPRRPPR